MKNTLSKLALAGLLSLTAVSANAADYTFAYTNYFKSIDAISKSGTIVGTVAFDYPDPSGYGYSYQSFRATWTGNNNQYTNRLNELSNSVSIDIRGINDSGQVIGNSYFNEYNTNVPHATLWSNGTATNLAPAYGLASQASSISNSGVVTGTSDSLVNNVPTTQDTQWNNGTITYNTNPSSPIQPTLDRSNYDPFQNYLGTTTYRINNVDGSTTTLGQLNNGTEYFDVNQSGQAVGTTAIFTPTGYYGGGVTNYQATLWNGTTAIKLDNLSGYSNSLATGINAAGQIIGYSSNSLSINQLRNLDYLLRNNDINQSYNTLELFSRYAAMNSNMNGLVPTLWNGTTAINLNDLTGETLRSAYLLDSGTILGVKSLGYDPHVNYGFSLYSITPVPEADTSAMLLMGAGVMGFMSRRRKHATV